MTATLPSVSIVIPTHNRRDSVCRTLDSLSRQTCPPGRFEIVVAANACTDGTPDAVRALMMACELRVLDLPAPGAAAARNAGARAARGALLIFLDDDIAVAPEFVWAHMEAHDIAASIPPAELPPRVALGYLPAALQPDGDFFAIALRGWWEAMFDRVREPGHRFAYTDLLTGNFSIPREHFIRLGAFDERYRCHEDYELGYRLISAGFKFEFAERACGYHADVTRLTRACSRKREEGRADVQLAAQHPSLRPALLMTRRRSRNQRVIRWIAFNMPSAGDRIAGLLARLLRLLERVGARASWARVLYGIFGYWYERGVADAARTRSALQPLLSEPDSGQGTQGRSIQLDVSDLDAAEQRLDTERPAAVTLCVGSRAFGELAFTPGAEPLAGRHLRPALTRLWSRQYVQALVAENLFPVLAPAGERELSRESDPAVVDSIGLLPEPAPPPPGR